MSGIKKTNGVPSIGGVHGKQRAWSTMRIKASNTDTASGKRTFTGIASTPETDRMGDIVVPEGAKFKLPFPLLWQHNSDEPIGWVTSVKFTSEGIEVECEVASTDIEGELKDCLDKAWQCITMGLVAGLSIGFNPIEAESIPGTWGYKFLTWEWLELSAVTIPANAGSGITGIAAVKSFDKQTAASSGKGTFVVRALTPPGASGSTPNPPPKPVEGNMNIAEQIKNFEATRAAKAARMVTLLEKAGAEGVTLNAEEATEHDGLRDEIDQIDKHLERLNHMQKSNLATLRPVSSDPGTDAAAIARAGGPANAIQVSNLQVRAEVETRDGLALAQMVRFLGRAKGAHYEAFQMALAFAEAGGKLDKRVIPVLKAAVAAGSTTNSTWAGALVGEESSIYADFVEFLRPLTVIGKFGQGGIPSLRRVPFRVALIGQTSGGAGYWVGEGQAKPLTKFDFARTTLEPLKVANIAVLTQETIRDSSPAADALIRDALVAALQERMDVDFIDPAKTASAGISPASITNGITPIHSSGDDAAHVRQDLKSLFGTFIAANNAPTSGVWVMDSVTALALSLMMNPLGQPEFNGITMNGGIFQGLPVITSQYVPSDTAGGRVALVNASDIYWADDGGFDLAMSTEASLQMDSAPTHNSTTPTAAQLVSMFQTNSAAFRAERTLNWARRRASAVALLDNVQWGNA